MGPAPQLLFRFFRTAAVPNLGRVGEDLVTVKPVSRADVAWHILTLAEDPDPGPLRIPVITTGPGRENQTAGTD
jgi:hypothetical protein